MRVVTARTGDKYPESYERVWSQQVEANLPAGCSYTIFHELPAPGWWGKLSLFAGDEETLWLGIDCHVRENLQPLFDYRPGELVASVAHRPGGKRFGLDADIIRIPAHEYAWVWDKFQSDRETIMRDWVHDQAWLESLNLSWQFYPGSYVTSYKWGQESYRPIIVHFHGDPKPHTIPDYKELYAEHEK